jgi:hypothetical protein
MFPWLNGLKNGEMLEQSGEAAIKRGAIPRPINSPFQPVTT